MTPERRAPQYIPSTGWQTEARSGSMSCLCIVNGHIRSERSSLIHMYVIKCVNCPPRVDS